MSNRRKPMRMKLPKPTMAKATEVTGAEHLNRRQLRSMRRRVPVILVLDQMEKEHTHDHH